MTLTVRPAAPSDAHATARCQFDCWREAYTDLAGADVVARRTTDLAPRVELWQRIIAAGDHTSLAVSPVDGVVGFVVAGSGRDEDIDLSLELKAMYLRARHQGSGVADRLLDVALGPADAYLWVFEDNPRARRFYARRGFVADGTGKHDPKFGLQEVRMVRRRVRQDLGHRVSEGT